MFKNFNDYKINTYSYFYVNVKTTLNGEIFDVYIDIRTSRLIIRKNILKQLKYTFEKRFNKAKTINGIFKFKN